MFKIFIKTAMLLCGSICFVFLWCVLRWGVSCSETWCDIHNTYSDSLSVTHISKAVLHCGLQLRPLNYRNVSGIYWLLNSYGYRISFLFFWNLKPDDGCLLQPKHVAVYITILKRCVRTDGSVDTCCISVMWVIILRLIGYISQVDSTHIIRYLW